MITLTAIFLSLVCLASLYIVIKHSIRADRLQRIDQLQWSLADMFERLESDLQLIDNCESAARDYYARMQRQLVYAASMEKLNVYSLSNRALECADSCQEEIDHCLNRLVALKMHRDAKEETILAIQSEITRLKLRI